MGDSKIQWTEKTWNPVVGCSIVSPGCHHCYAAVLARRLRAMALADLAVGRNPGRKRHYIDAVDDNGRWTGRLIPVTESLPDPASWRAPRLVFVNSMSDLFHESLPSEFIARVFARMIDVQRHSFQVLTKRPDRMAYLLNNPEFWWTVRTWLKGNHISPATDAPVDDSPIIAPNIHLGTSVEDQKRADERIPELLKVPAAVRFLSMEPLLGPIQFERSMACICDNGRIQYGDKNFYWCNLCRGASSRSWSMLKGIGWGIVGGESGHKARPCNIRWIRSLVAQYKAAEVPCFVKQLGERLLVPNDSGDEWPRYGDEWIYDADKFPRMQGKDVVLHMPHKGDQIDTWPEDLRVRQFPAAKVLA